MQGPDNREVPMVEGGDLVYAEALSYRDHLRRQRRQAEDRQAGRPSSERNMSSERSAKSGPARSVPPQKGGRGGFA